ncbi:AIPR family protein [Paenibacillus wulumuqiensis]|uniref:AIPR family protein n=1 Tax=Paenibacillus wulumuqiensis TaxID=1567107 RepID=UPI000619A5D4|nr:AIPR family protein [Paenibacillus wulumuqiensis]
MDRITKNLLDEFISENVLNHLPQETAFEHFTGALVTANHYSESFSTFDISVGAGNDCGIDCLAIIVNGCLVSEPEEIEDLAETNGYLDISFVFIQSERSSNFDTQKIGQFGFGVQDIFSDNPALPQNDHIRAKSKILNVIFEQSRLFKKGNPQCFLYYATTGQWVNDRNLVVRKESVVEDLRQLGLFRKVVFECIGAERLQTLYRNLRNSITQEITFINRTVFPEMQGVEQSYLGFVPVPEFLKLIENDTGDMNTSIFYDNVRDWQEWNPVNTEIKETLETVEKKVLFPLLNNGVTIVAKRLHPTGNKFVVEDYQIVNGCQTSYVLHESKAFIDESILVPIRLISTNDPEVKNQIIKATNRQTEVTEDQLFALAEFPKKLEAYFPSFDGYKKLYYERRSRQYNAVPNIEKVRVVSMTTLVKSFASLFLDLPHRTSRNYKLLLKNIGTEILNPEHKLEMYYVAAYAQYRLEYLFRSQAISSELKTARYHLLMAFRKLAIETPMPRFFNSNEMARYCNQLMNVLWDETQYKDVFRQAADMVTTITEGEYNRDNIRTEGFTERLNQDINERNAE